MSLLVFLTSTALAGVARGEDASSLLDDFSDPVHTSVGTNRIAIDDASVGGTSHLKQTFADGVLSAEGEINPARGQPGWVSLVLPLAPNGEAVDLSKYDGIRIRVRIRKGMLSISANSSEITNFDYHAAMVPAGGEFKEVRIAFKDMKRAWSEQTPLNRATITSISLVAVDFQKSAFACDVDEVGFY